MSHARLLIIGFWASITLTSPQYLAAQDGTITSTPTGDPAFGTRSSTIDNIDLNTLNANIKIPLATIPGRGAAKPFTVYLDYNTGSENGLNPTVGRGEWYTSFTPTVGLAYSSVDGSCGDGGGSYLRYNFLDTDGGRHPFPVDTPCNPVSSPVGGVSAAYDGSGYSLAYEFFPDGTGSISVTDVDGGVLETCNRGAYFGLGGSCQGQGVNGFSIFDSIYMQAYAAYNGTLQCLSGCPQAPGSQSWTVYQDRNGNQINQSLLISTDYSSATSTIKAPSGASLTFTYSMSDPLVSNISYLDSNGNTETTKINYTYFNICYLSPCSNNQTAMPTSVVYPDGTSYQFGYEPNLSVAGAVTGRLSMITQPTGGQISYHYGNAGDPSGSKVGINYCDGPAQYDPQYTTGFSRTTSDGITTYSRAAGISAAYYPQYYCAAQTTITPPSGDQTVITFGGPFVGNELEIGRTVYRGSATSNSPLLTTTQTYTYGTTLDTSTSLVGEGIKELDKTTVLPNGLSSHVDTKYFVGTYPSEVDEYDFGATAPTRKTLTSYATLSNGILAKPNDVKVSDSNNNQASESRYSYDESNVVASGSSVSPAPVTVSGSRGNLTKVTQVNPGFTSSTTISTYYDTGTTQSVTDPNGTAGMNGTVTTYVYDASGAFPSSMSVAGPGISTRTMQLAFDDNTGLLGSVTDWNNQTTSYAYDSVGRRTVEQYPVLYNGTRAGSLYCYNFLTGLGTSTAYSTSPSGCSNRTPNSKQVTTIAAPDPNITVNTAYDAMGRVIRVVQADGNAVEMSYDANGRLQWQSNPHGPSAAQTDGYTAFTYDSLNRKLLQCQPDNGTGSTSCSPGASYLSWTYDQSVTNGIVGNPMTSVDEVSNSTQLVSDALGRLTQVTQPGALTTTYTYDLLNNLTSVQQQGLAYDTPRSRSFTYDSLSRLLCASNPENSSNPCPATVPIAIPSGFVSYSYDPNGNMVSKTDSRGVSVDYFYDSLNRLSSKSYSGATSSPPGTASGEPTPAQIASRTPTSSYVYDVPTSGMPVANAVGRLVNESTLLNGTTLTSRSISGYDPLGRILGEQQCTLASCSAQLQYSYDLAGNVLSSTNGFGGAGAGALSLSYNYNAAGQLQQLSSSWNDSSHPAILFAPPSAGLQYGPMGLVNSSMGISTVSAQPIYTQVMGYDNRRRKTAEMDQTSGFPTPANGTITINGEDSTHSVCLGRNCNQVPDAGTIQMVLSPPGSNSVAFTASVNYDGEDNSTLAGEIASAFNQVDSQNHAPIVTANSTGDEVILTTISSGSSANYGLTGSVTDQQDYAYTLSGSSLSGGSDGASSSIYFNGSGYTANGNVQSSVDSVMGSWSYGYDSLNRLKTGQASANTQTGYGPYGSASLTWQYDSFGNYLGQELYGNTQATVFQGSYSYNGNNQVNGVSYDLAGNVRSSITTSDFTYDADGRLDGVDGAYSYIYDAEGRRTGKVASSVVYQGNLLQNAPTNQYLLGLHGELITELDGQGNWLRSNVYALGKLMSTYDIVGLHFHFSDGVGTRRVQASGTGTLEDSCMSLPFGDSLQCTNANSDATEQHYSGKERDAESGLDNFEARYYSSNMGRMMSPDPSGLYFADPRNPQSLNLYSYVMNNPLRYTDPTGRTCQTNSSDGNTYDDGDGQGCTTVDQQEADHQKNDPASATAYAGANAAMLETRDALSEFGAGGAKPTLNYLPNDPFTLNFQRSLGMQAINAKIKGNCSQAAGGGRVGTGEAAINSGIDHLTGQPSIAEDQLGGFTYTYSQQGGTVDVTVSNPITLNSLAYHALASGSEDVNGNPGDNVLAGDTMAGSGVDRLGRLTGSVPFGRVDQVLHIKGANPCP